MLYFKNKLNPFTGKLQKIVDAFKSIGFLTGQLTGFPNRTDSTYSWDDGTLTFSIEPTGSSFEFWNRGIKRTVTSTQSIVGDGTDFTIAEGTWYFYYDPDGVLSASQTQWDFFDGTAFISVGYWDDTNSVMIGMAPGDERHSHRRNPEWHWDQHERIGAWYEWGLTPTVTVDGNGSLDSHAEIAAVTAGEIHDEDIEHEIDQTTSWQMLYFSGAGALLRATAASVAAVDVTATRPNYNEFTGGAWQVTEVDNTKFTLTHLIAIHNEIFKLMGQNQYVSAVAAQAGAETEILNISTGMIPLPETVYLATFIIQCQDSYTNSYNARLISTAEGDDFVDWRLVELTANGGTSANQRLVDLVDVDDTNKATNTILMVNAAGNHVYVDGSSIFDFSFSIASFSDGIADTSQLIGSGVWIVSDGVSFTATYNNGPPASAVVTESGGSTGWTPSSVSIVAGSAVSPAATYYPASRTGTVTFTLTADLEVDTESVSFSNTLRYGNSTLTQGNQTEASLEELSEVAGPNESRSQTISNIATTANYLVFAWAQALSGNVTQVQGDFGSGYVTCAFASAATTVAPDVQSDVTNVANSAGFSETFECITSLITGLANGTNDFKVMTSSTAQNYVYWGELNKSSGYTEADIEGNYATEPGKVATNTISSRSMTVNAAVDEYVYIAYPTRLGTISSILIGGFESVSDFTEDTTTLAVTNDGGFQENYTVLVSTYPGFSDPTTMVVTI